MVQVEILSESDYVNG